MNTLNMASITVSPKITHSKVYDVELRTVVVINAHAHVVWFQISKDDIALVKVFESKQDFC